MAVATGEAPRPPVCPGKVRRRRWLLAAVVALVLFTAIAVGGRFLWLPTYRPALQPGERYGVDVSAYQGRIDWRAVAADHIGFVYIKATEGATYVDRAFAANWAAAASTGLPHGAYHFFSFCSPGAAQAENFLRTVPRDGTELMPAVDLELAGNCHRRPSRAAVDAQLTAFLSAVQAVTGRTVVIYLGADYARRYPLPPSGRHPLWLRRVLRRPAAGSWLIWQVDANATVRGIHGAVDLDVMRAADGSG